MPRRTSSWRPGAFACVAACAACGCTRTPSPGSSGDRAPPPADRAPASSGQTDAATNAPPLVVLPSFDSPSPSAGRAPRATYEAAKACIARKDYLGVWELMSGQTQATVDGQLPPTLGEWRHFNPDGFKTLFGMTALEFEQMPVGRQYALLALRSHLAAPDRPKSFAESEFLAQKAEADASEVTYRRPDGTTATMRLVRENDVWKLAGTTF